MSQIYSSAPARTSPRFPAEWDQLPVGAPVLLAGRVVHVAADSVVLSDARRSIPVRLPGRVDLSPGAWLVVSGLRGEHALTDAHVVTSAPGTFSLQGDFARLSRVAKNLEQRASARRAIREYFTEAGFLEVETPTRVTAPGTDVYLEPVPSGPGWLITSPEFHLKRLLVGGLPRVFEFARCFRRDEAGSWHEPEFTMLEWYRAFEDYESVLRDTEHLVERVRKELGVPTCITVSGRSVELSTPFERTSCSEVFARYAGVTDVAALAANDEDTYFRLWVDAVEPALAALGRPVFVLEFPLSQAALARPCPHDGRYAERFELFVGGVELCNAYGELTAPDVQRARFEHDVAARKARGLPDLPLDESFLAALREGLPPSAGNALGFDRLLALLLQAPLAEAVAFPAPR